MKHLIIYKYYFLQELYLNLCNDALFYASQVPVMLIIFHILLKKAIFMKNNCLSTLLIKNGPVMFLVHINST
jgi:hypothetical protein